MKFLFFNADWYILTFLNLDLLTFLTSICFGDVKFNIITLVKDVTVVSRFDPRLVFSYAFFFVKIVHLLNVKPCFQIFFICLCPIMMRFYNRKEIYMRDDSFLLHIAHFAVIFMFTSLSSSFNFTSKFILLLWTLYTIFVKSQGLTNKNFYILEMSLLVSLRNVRSSIC